MPIPGNFAFDLCAISPCRKYSGQRPPFSVGARRHSVVQGSKRDADRMAPQTAYPVIKHVIVSRAATRTP
jgi:hypothetical protein